MSELQRKTVEGVSWNAVISVVRIVKQLVLGIVLMRLLPPEVFGLIAMVMVISNYASLFKDMGFNAAIMQVKELKPIHKDSVFWFNIAMGLVICALFFFSANLISRFYEQPELVDLVKVMSTIFIINSFGSVQLALFKRDLDFKSISLATIFAVFLSAGVTIYLAYNGWGVWALVVQYLLESVILVCAYWLLSSWRPQFTATFQSIKDLSKFGLNFFGSSTVTYWSRKMDDILIGKVMGKTPLGVYSKAYGFLLFPIILIKQRITSVLFPAFSKIQDDIQKLKVNIKKVISIQALILIPIMALFFACAEEFVLYVLGAKWKDMIPLVKIFAVSGIFEGILISSTVLNALGRSDLQFRRSLICRLITLGFIVFGLQYGLQGVALAVLAGSFIYFMVMEWFTAYPKVGIEKVEVLKSVLPFVGLFVLTALVGEGLNLSLGQVINNGLIYFVAKGATLALFILVVLLLWQPKPFKMLLNLLQPLMRNLRSRF